MAEARAPGPGGGARAGDEGGAGASDDGAARTAGLGAPGHGPLGDAEAPASPTGPTILLVHSGEGEYGIPVERVREVIETPPVTRVPLAPDAVAGVASVRGDIIPVVDLGVRLRGTRTAAARRLVTVDWGEDRGRVGLLADDVVGMLQVSSPEAVEAVPADIAGGLPEGVASGVYSPTEARLIVILNLDGVLAIDAAAEER